MKPERRTFALDKVRIEERGENASPLIRGHAAIFDTLSENLGGFREKIAPGAFDGVLQDDVRALFNHDGNIVLGRTKAGTLRLSVDSEGLNYEIDPPDTQAARDLIVSMKRGDISESSFAFTVENDSWDEDEDGRLVRTINKVKRLYDVSPVTYPAYQDTDVAARSLQEWKDKQRQTESSQLDNLDLLKRKLALAEAE